MVMIEDAGEESFGLQESFARELLRKANCPVWVIPDNLEYHTIRSVIYATDYHEEDITTLRKLIRLLYFLSPEIIALHITDNADFELRIKNAGFQKLLESKTEYETVFAKALIERPNEDIPDMITRHARQAKADLIVVLKENRTFLERLINPSVSGKIIQKSSLPVLVYHMYEDA